MTGQARGPRAARLAAPQAFRLRAGLAYCFVADRAIFLDLPADRYFCLAPALEAGFRAWLAGEADRRTLENLRVLRLIEAGADPFEPAAPSELPPATASLLDCPASASLAMRGSAWFHLALAASRLRLAGLARSVAHARASKPRPRHATSSANSQTIALAARIAQAHEAAALIASSHDKCLPRALALGAHLASAGVCADFVIGVRLRPFGAHSWIQLGEAAVNDRTEHVRTFAPILIV